MIGNMLGEAWVSIDADLKPLKKGIDKAHKVTLSGVTNISKKAMVKAKWIGLGFAAISTASVKMAMDVQESENLFAVSMGAMAEETRAWSRYLAKAIGMSSYVLRENVAMLNAMFSSMGFDDKKAAKISKSLTGLAYDMASFYNLKPQEAFDKLRAGITGEAEPLKRLGILISENVVKQYAYKNGIAETGAELTEMQKVLARYVAIMDQTTQAHGDMVRTQSSLTNVWRSTVSTVKDAAVAYGSQLIPVIAKVLTKVRDFVQDSMPQIEIFGKFVAEQLGKVVDYFENLMAIVDSKGWKAAISSLTQDVISGIGKMLKALVTEVIPLTFKVGKLIGSGIVDGITTMFKENHPFLSKVLFGDSENFYVDGMIIPKQYQDPQTGKTYSYENSHQAMEALNARRAGKALPVPQNDRLQFEILDELKRINKNTERGSVMQGKLNGVD